jgi:hypothetical protein
LFFGERSDVQLRLLQRWALRASEKLGGRIKNDEREQYGFAMKRLQIMETTVKLIRAWSTRTDGILKAVCLFQKGFASLETFADPVVAVCCPYFHETCLQVLATQATKEDMNISDQLTRPLLQSRFDLDPVAGVARLQAIQKMCFEQMVVTLLVGNALAHAIPACQERVLSQFIKNKECCDSGSTIHSEVEEVLHLLQLPPVSSDSAGCGLFVGALNIRRRP